MKWTAVLPLALLSCYGPAPAPERVDETPRIRAESYGAEKARLVGRMEERMNELMARSLARIREIHDTLQEGLAGLQPPAHLLADERTFRGYGAAEREQFGAAVDRLVASAVADAERLVGRDKTPELEAIEGDVEREAKALAREIGGSGQGAGYGFISGVKEVDERAEATIELLQEVADPVGLRDLGAIRKAEVLELARAMHHDLVPEDYGKAPPRAIAEVRSVADASGVERLGRMILFQSDELEGFRIPQQDTIAVVVAFQNDRLPVTHQYSFLQAARFRIARGGMLVQDTGWSLDPGTHGRDGRLAPRRHEIDPRFFATEPFFPSVNVDHELFPELRDFTVISDYKTGLLDETTGEVLGAFSWQVQWMVSQNGAVQFQPGVNPSFDPLGSEVAELLRRGAASGGATLASGERPPNPSDLFPTRALATDRPFQPVERVGANGQRFTLTSALDSDHLRVTAPGRQWLLDHRLRIFSSEAEFFSYLDGRRGRYVLRLSSIGEDSAARDLGFRSGDDLLSVNGVEIRNFQDLWTYLADHGRERSYVVAVDRNGANREFRFDVDGVPAPGQDDTFADEELTGEQVERINRLFKQGSEGDG